MSRADFLIAYADRLRVERGVVASTEEAAAHRRDRDQAAQIWRQQKARLQTLSVEQWQKLQAAK